MSMSSASRHRSNKPFSDPHTWKENNPYKPSVTSSSSSRRSSSRQPRRSRRISHIPGPDNIDRLGSVVGTPYHHDGPYEATLAARQIPGRAPVDALKESNAAILAATPAASIRDCLENHYPLQGVAMYPPGMCGLGNYEEYDVMVKDGNYKRWDHMTYRDEDRKGKGEPSFTIEEFEKQQKAARHAAKNAARHGGDEYEMYPPAKDGSRVGLSSIGNRMMMHSGGSRDVDDGGRLGGLKRRFNSLRKKDRLSS